MQFGIGYAVVSAGFALAYGAALLRSPPSTTRTIVKALGIGFLAFVTLIEDGPWLLAGALALCAIGDAFLAGDPEKDLRKGMAAFGAGHLVYIALFLVAGGGIGLHWIAIVAQLGVIAAIALIMRRLYPGLGAMRAPVLAYVGLIGVMTVLAIGLPPKLWIAGLGAATFLASDALLAFELFAWPADAPQRAWADRAVWALYYAGQAAIVYAFLERPV